MPKSKAEKEQARKLRKKAERRRLDEKRVELRTKIDTIEKIARGAATAEDVARVLNVKHAPAPTYDATTLARQVKDLRGMIDHFVEGMTTALNKGYRDVCPIPGTVFVGRPEDDSEPDAADDVHAFGAPLVMAGPDTLSFGPVEEALDDFPGSTAAAWLVCSGELEFIDGPILIAMVGNADGARATYLIHEGRWALLNSVEKVREIFVDTLVEQHRELRSEAFLLPLALEMWALQRGSDDPNKDPRDLVAEGDVGKNWRQIRGILDRIQVTRRDAHDEIIGLATLVSAQKNEVIEARAYILKLVEQRNQAIEAAREADRQLFLAQQHLARQAEIVLAASPPTRPDPAPLPVHQQPVKSEQPPMLSLSERLAAIFE